MPIYCQGDANFQGAHSVTLEGASGGQTGLRASRVGMSDPDANAVAAQENYVQRCTVTSATGTIEDKFSSRSRTNVAQVRNSATITASGSLLLAMGGESHTICNMWRPPRPYAGIILTDTEALTMSATTRNHDSTVYYDDDAYPKETCRPRRRNQRRGPYYFRNDKTYRQLSKNTFAKPQLNWSCAIDSRAWRRSKTAWNPNYDSEAGGPTTWTKTGIIISDNLISSGPRNLLANRTGIVISNNLIISGADVDTSIETGTIISPAVASAADIATTVETGALISDKDLSGADTDTSVETGAIIQNNRILSGADVDTSAETGAIISAAQPSGADIFNANETGSIIQNNRIVSGADVDTSIETGSIISDKDVSGADSVVTSDTGSVISDKDLSGIGLKTQPGKTGVIISALVAAGSKLNISSKTGIIISDLNISGADATSFVESGSVISDRVASASKIVNYTRAGKIIGDWILKGLSQVLSFFHGGSVTLMDESANVLYIEDFPGSFVELEEHIGDSVRLEDDLTI